MKRESHPLFLRKLFSIALIFAMAMGMMFAFAPIVYAAAPALATTTMGKINNTISSTAWATGSVGNPNTQFTAGDTLVAYLDCYYTGTQPSVLSITDGLSTGSLTWVFDGHYGPPSVYAGDGAHPANALGFQEMWSAATPAVPSDTTWSLTLTFSSTVAGCEMTFYKINALMSPSFTLTASSSYAGSSFPSLQLVTAFTNIPAGALAIFNFGNNMEYSTGSTYSTQVAPVDSAANSYNAVGSSATICLAPSPFTCVSPSAGVDYATDNLYYFYYSSSVNVNVHANYNGGSASQFNPTFTMLGVVFVATTSVSSVQTQTVGSCPPGGGTGIGHFALANSTQYWYSGNALGSEVVNTISTEVSSIKGSGSHTLQLMIYIGLFSSPTVTFPATLAYAKSFTVSSGTTNSTITTQVNIPLNAAQIPPLPFNFWAVAIVGDDHIFIAGSSLSGLTTQTGAVSTASQPATFTASGSASTNKLALCTQASYQSVLPSQTITTTQAATTTSVVSVTSTISTINAQVLFSTSANWPLVFLFLLLPAGLFMGATKSFSGGLIGLMVGAIICIMAGIIPSWIFIGLVICIASMAFILRERNS